MLSLVCQFHSVVVVVVAVVVVGGCYFLIWLLVCVCLLVCLFAFFNVCLSCAVCVVDWSFRPLRVSFFDCVFAA